MPEQKHIAILGGGAAGLVAAYFLHNRLSRDGEELFRCTVFDVSERLGGNCHSAYLGDQTYERPMADLGVNDFNVARYMNFMAVLDQLAKDGFPVLHEPLIDSTTWYTPRGVTVGARTYTDEELAHWQKHKATKPWLENIAHDWDAFQGVAGKVLRDEKYARMSVNEFIAEEGYSCDFAEYNLRARINGMYYVNDLSPGEMPIRAVMAYYHLQEGIGEDKLTEALKEHSASASYQSPRHYFVRGASDWIRQLTLCLEKRGVTFRLGESPVLTHAPTPPRATGTSPRPWRQVAPAEPEHPGFDHVISAVHADRVGRVIDEGITADMLTALSQFDYYSSISIVHDDESMLPADEPAWSTYNILVYPPESQMLRPYTITYVSKKHQGVDSDEPPYVTLTPFQPIADAKIAHMLRLPDEQRILSVSTFRHNTLTWEAIAAQEHLHTEQGKNNLWFTGGWTNGAGLHEEIIAMSKEIALHIRGIPQEGAEGYHADNLGRAPQHIEHSFDPDPEPFPQGFWDTHA